MCETRTRVIDVLAAHGGFSAWVRSHIDENFSTCNSLAKVTDRGGKKFHLKF